MLKGSVAWLIQPLVASLKSTAVLPPTSVAPQSNEGDTVGKSELADSMARFVMRNVP
jgi:hypothetical protein